jgi:hypothetical protein
MADEDNSGPAFKPNDASIKSVDELMKRDQDDESLNKWKASLLGKALSEDTARKTFSDANVFKYQFSERRSS